MKNENQTCQSSLFFFFQEEIFHHHVLPIPIVALLTRKCSEVQSVSPVLEIQVGILEQGHNMQHNEETIWATRFYTNVFL